MKLKVHFFGGKLINEAVAARGQIQSHHHNNRLYIPLHEVASKKNMTTIIFKAMKEQLLKMAGQAGARRT